MATLKKHRNKRFTCPYCGAPAVLRNAESIYGFDDGTMAYVCKNYPRCDSYIRAFPGTEIPMGTLANAKLRRIRNVAHRFFDQLYLSNLMTRDAAYEWLAFWLACPHTHAHIALLDEYECRLLIEKSIEFLSNNAWKVSGYTEYLFKLLREEGYLNVEESIQEGYSFDRNTKKVG